MMGVTSLEVYNTVYNITGKNNKLQILFKHGQLLEHGLDFVLVIKIQSLFEFYNLEYQEAYYELVEKVNTIITSSYSENNKLARKDFDYKQINSNIPITISEFEIQDDCY